jgi:HD-GYP domain-containing protein (c-di-GMP phosphodiesterase class II)
LAAAFARVAAREEFWRTLRSEDLQRAIFALEPAQHSAIVDEDYLDDISVAFAKVIDSKSPYTSGHSERVTLFSDMIAEHDRYDRDRPRCRLLRGFAPRLGARRRDARRMMKR